MKTRKCSKCKKDLPLTRNFFYYDKKGKYGLAYMCIECTKKNVDRCRKNNPEAKEKHTKRCRKWRKRNPEKTKEACNKYREKNRLFCNRLSADYKAKHKKYYKEHHKQYMNYKRRTDLKFNLNSKMAIAIGTSLRGNKNGKKWEDLINYTIKDLKERLQNTIPQGYDWRDFLNGELHIDHILPIKLFQFKTPEDEEFKQCWSLYNLRLLSAKENILKRENITNSILLWLLLKEERVTEVK